MDDTYGTYVDDECLDIRDDDDDADGDTEDDTNDDAHDETDDGGRGHLCTIKVPSCCSWVPGSCCLSGCRPRRRPCLKHTANNFCWGGCKKTIGAGSICLELATVHKLVATKC